MKSITVVIATDNSDLPRERSAKYVKEQPSVGILHVNHRKKLRKTGTTTEDTMEKTVDIINFCAKYNVLNPNKILLQF